MTHEELYEKALELGKENHCRYCAGWNNDERLKCRHDIESFATEMCELVEEYFAGVVNSEVPKVDWMPFAKSVVAFVDARSGVQMNPYKVATHLDKEFERLRSEENSNEENIKSTEPDSKRPMKGEK